MVQNDELACAEIHSGSWKLSIRRYPLYTKSRRTLRRQAAVIDVVILAGEGVDMNLTRTNIRQETLID